MSPEERIAFLETKRWIAYQTANQVMERLEWILNQRQQTRMQNLLIYGHTNNGKTDLVTKFLNQQQKRQSTDGATEVRILCIEAPPLPDEDALYLEILEKIDAPHPRTQKIASRRIHVRQILSDLKLRMLIIDEVHHILAGSSNKHREMLNVLKSLSNHLCIPLVAVGTEEARLAFQRDPELDNRFHPVELPVWRFGNDFRALLSSFERTYPLREASELKDPEIAQQIYNRTGGLIGEVSLLLKVAAQNAIRMGSERIDRRALEDVWFSPPSQRGGA